MRSEILPWWHCRLPLQLYGCLKCWHTGLFPKNESEEEQQLDRMHVLLIMQWAAWKLKILKFFVKKEISMLDVEGNRAHPQELYSVAGQLHWTRTVLRPAEQRAGCLPILRAAFSYARRKENFICTLCTLWSSYPHLFPVFQQHWCLLNVKKKKGIIMWGRRYRGRIKKKFVTFFKNKGLEYFELHLESICSML